MQHHSWDSHILLGNLTIASGIDQLNDKEKTEQCSLNKNLYGWLLADFNTLLVSMTEQVYCYSVLSYF